MKIQLVGSYSKIGPARAIPIFKTLQNALEKRGHEISNPCEMVKEGTEWGEAMKICLDNIPKMDAIYTINNWVISTGAILEVKESILYGLKIFNQFNPPPKIKK